MEKRRLEDNQSGAISWFKENWSHNALFSTVFALVVMVLIQCVVMWVNAGSFGGMFGKMGMAWLNILRNNAYQGVIALAASFLSPFLGEEVIAEMTCVGSLLIVALGLNMLDLTKIKVMNLVPAIFLPILLCLFM